MKTLEFYNKKGRHEHLDGPMKSGKTASLISRLKVIKEYSHKKIQTFKPSIDSRNEQEGICCNSDLFSYAFNGLRWPAVIVQNPIEIINLTQVDTNFVVIDEVQFFSKTILLVVDFLRCLGKTVITAGISLDHQGEPFGVSPALAIRADDSNINHGICECDHQDHNRKICGYTNANFSYLKKEHDGSDSRIKVGRNEYGVMCKFCYIAHRDQRYVDIENEKLFHIFETIWSEKILKEEQILVYT